MVRQRRQSTKGQRTVRQRTVRQRTKRHRKSNRTHIKCLECEYIVPYKIKVKKGPFRVTKKYNECRRCKKELSEKGKIYPNM